MKKPQSPSLYQQINELLQQSRQHIKSSVNQILVQTYWHVGRIIVEEEQGGQHKAEYGAGVLKELAAQLTKDYGKGFDASNLRYMRLFYKAFPNCDALRHELSWTHYRLLLKLDSADARQWYINEAINENWSSRALERQINSHYYQRLLASQNPAPVKAEATAHTQNLTAQNILKDPYVLEFLQLKTHSSYSEAELETALLDQLHHFLLELGSGFSFVARQKRIDIDAEYFTIDLVFYHIKLKCYVLIDLKLGKLTHQDIGQMDTYVRIYEEQMRGEDDNPTIGLILCSDKSRAVAKYSILADNQHIFASKYKLHLPTEKELIAELQKDLQSIHKNHP